MDGLFAQDGILFRQVLDHQAVAVKDELALEQFPCFFREAAFLVHRAQDGQIVFQTGEIVHVPMAGSCMDAAGTGFLVHIVRQHHQGFPVVVFREGMFAFRIFKGTAFGGPQHRPEFHAAFLGHFVHHVSGHDQHFPVVFHPGIVKVRVQGHSHVGGNGPGGGGPDHHIGFFALGGFRGQPVVLHQGHLHENGRGLLVGVFDFRFRQGRFAVGAPVYGLLAFVDVAFVGHGAEHPDLFRFEMGIQGHIGMVPVTQHTQPFEILPLGIDPLEGIFPAHFPQFHRGQLVTVHAGGLQAGMFDGHAVGIPAGDIGGVIPLGVFVFDDDVLQDLVQGMAHVDLAVGVGRSVVEDELLVACMEFLFFSIDIVFIPEIQEIRFPFGQARPHGEFSFRQVQRRCILVVFLAHCFTPPKNKSRPPKGTGQKGPWYHPHDSCAATLYEVTVITRVHLLLVR